MKKLFFASILLCFAAADFVLSQSQIPSLQNPATSSSFLPKSNISSYSSSNLIDFNLETAWVEGVKGNGVNEWFALYIGNLEDIGNFNQLEVFVASGYQKSQQVFKNNAMPTVITLELYLDQKKIISKDFECKSYEGDEFTDCWGGFERTTIKMPGLNVYKGALWLKGIIKEYRKGSMFEDNSISEVFCNLVGVNPNNAIQRIQEFFKAVQKNDKKILKEFTNLPIDEFADEIPSEELIGDLNLSFVICSTTKVVCHWLGTQCGNYSLLFNYENGKWRLKKKAILKGVS